MTIRAGVLLDLIFWISFIVALIHVLLFLVEIFSIQFQGIHIKKFKFEGSSLVTTSYGKTKIYHRDDFEEFEIRELKRHRTSLGFFDIEKDYFLQLLVVDKSFKEAEDLITEVINIGVSQWEENEKN